MTTQTFSRNLLIVVLLFACFTSIAQNVTVPGNTKTKSEPVMKTYLIEREIPDAGKLTTGELKGISQTSCTVLKDMGPAIQWIHSYVTGNKIYCIYKAENEELLREHGKKGGFPVTAITEISSTISPETAK